MHLNVCMCFLCSPSRVAPQGLPEARKGRYSLAPLWWTPRDPFQAGEASTMDSWERAKKVGITDENNRPVKLSWFALFDMFLSVI